MNISDMYSEMLKDIKAVIFDMDGTLIDSMFVWKDIDKEFLGNRNITMPEDLQQGIEGKSFHETAVYFKERFDLPEDLDTIKSIWNDMAFDKYANSLALKKGAKAFLSFLSERGIKMGIATSNSRELTQACLSNLGVLQYFDTIVTGNEILKGKPNPDIYLKASSNLNVNPANCLVFEDIVMGIRAGKNAGMRTCAVYDLYSMYMDDDKREEADYYIMDFEEILFEY